MRGEFNALRRVAALASDYVATLGPDEAGHAGARDLRAALDDLHARYPYMLESRSLLGELHALIHDGLGQSDRGVVVLDEAG